MKKAVLAIAGSLLFLPWMVTFAPSFPSQTVLAAPAQLFGRDTPKKDKTRLLTGKVLDGSDGPLPNAVVYLTNTRTRSVKTYIVGPEGTYRFPGLEPTTDYEVYAQLDKRKSGTKTLSQFDDRQEVYIDLKVSSK